MKKVSTLIASLPLITTACGGGGGGSSDNISTSNTDFDLADYKGTYSNDSTQTITSSSGGDFEYTGSTAIITSDKHLAVLTSDLKALFLNPDTLTGSYYSALSYVDDIEFTLARNSNRLSIGFNNSQRGITGTLTFTNTNTYNTAASSFDLSGTWVDDNTDDYYYANNGTWTLTILADGSFTATSTSICRIDAGQLTPISQNANEYSVTMSVSSCGSFNGTHTGIALVEDGDPTDRLVIIANNGSYTLGIKPVR